MGVKAQKIIISLYQTVQCKHEDKFKIWFVLIVSVSLMLTFTHCYIVLITLQNESLISSLQGKVAQCVCFLQTILSRSNKLPRCKGSSP